jgi:hypothetical protein
LETKRWRLVWCIVNASNFVYTMDNEENHIFVCFWESKEDEKVKQAQSPIEALATQRMRRWNLNLKILFLFKLLEVLKGGSIIKSNVHNFFFCCNIRWFSLLFWKIGLGLNPKLVWFYLAVQFLNALKFKLKFSVSLL